MSDSASTSIMERALRIGAAGVALTMLALMLLWTKRANFVLFHLFGESHCACGDYHEEVTGVSIWNPLRSREPERTAEDFLRHAAAGHCARLYDPSLCQYYEVQAPVRGWKLVNATKTGEGADFFYKLDSSRIDIVDRIQRPEKNWTGEGRIRVEHVNGGWHVASYDAYF